MVIFGTPQDHIYAWRSNLQSSGSEKRFHKNISKTFRDFYEVQWYFSELLSQAITLMIYFYCVSLSRVRRWLNTTSMSSCPKASRTSLDGQTLTRTRSRPSRGHQRSWWREQKEGLKRRMPVAACLTKGVEVPAVRVAPVFSLEPLLLPWQRSRSHPQQVWNNQLEVKTPACYYIKMFLNPEVVLKIKKHFSLLWAAAFMDSTVQL